MTITTLGVFLPRETPLHRIPAAIKLVLLIIAILFLAVFPVSNAMIIAASLITLSLFVVAKVPPKIAWQQLWPVLPMLCFITAYQWWLSGIRTAALISATIFITVALAVLLTLTTRVTELLSAFTYCLQPLSRLGLPADRLALALTLVIRSVPLMSQTINEVLTARKARGASFSLAAFGTPLIVRSLLRADALADALIARGVDDE